jgi:hypothetical protein
LQFGRNRPELRLWTRERGQRRDRTPGWEWNGRHFGPNRPRHRRWTSNRWGFVVLCCCAKAYVRFIKVDVNTALMWSERCYGAYQCSARCRWIAGCE